MSASSTLLILALLPLLMLPAGLVLLVVGLRGRRMDDHPLCRRCGFDLFGLPADSHLCSECGMDLQLPRAVRVGHRQKRTGLLTISLLLLLPSLAYLGAATYFVARGVDVNQYRPVWWLLLDANSTVPAIRNGALAALNSKLASNKLSTAQIDTIAENALKLQGDPSRTWDPGWGDFVELAQATNRLSAEKWQRYLKQAPTMRFQARAKVRRGAPLPLRLTHDARVGTQSTLWAAYRYKAVEISGRTTKGNAGSGGGTSLRSTSGGSSGWTVSADDPALTNLPDGPQTIRLTLDLDIHTYPAYNANNSRPPDATSTMTLETTWELVSGPTVTANTDPSHRPAVEKALTATIEPPRANGFHSTYISVNINSASPPVPLTFDVFLRHDGKEWKINPIAFPAGRSHGWHTGNNLPDFKADVADIILRPSLTAAESQVDFTEYWDGEVVLKNIPIQPRK